MKDSCDLEEEPKASKHSQTAYYWSDSSNSCVVTKSDIDREIVGKKKQTEGKTSFLIEVDNEDVKSRPTRSNSIEEGIKEKGTWILDQTNKKYFLLN